MRYRVAQRSAAARPGLTQVLGAVMKTNASVALLFLALGAGAQTAPATRNDPLIVQLSSPSVTQRPVSQSLSLRVTGGAKGFEVELISKKPVRGCSHNLVHLAPHGPDPSEVLPWQVAAGRFPNIRPIPVCGRPLMIVISLESPLLSGDNTQFTAGKLVVDVKPRKRISRAGT